MRHGKRFNHLGRTASHRKAMLSNMASSLIEHKRVSTTVAKAKELRKYVEPLITKAKTDTTHSRRVVFSYLQNKESVKALFGEVVSKVSERPGGYTRIIRTGNRLGDNAEMCIIELVDFNELLLQEKAEPAKKSRRRSRRGSGKAKAEEGNTQVAEAEVVEDNTAEAASEEAAATEAVEAKAEDEAPAANDAEESKEDDAPEGEEKKD